MDLSEAHLEGVLHVVGEFGYGSRVLLEFLDQHLEGESLIRVRTALEVISRIGGERLDVLAEALGPMLTAARSLGRLSPDIAEAAIRKAAEGDGWESRPLFSKEFGQTLERGKYTKWAANLSEADWDSLLVCLEAFKGRSRALFILLDQHGGEVQGLLRARIALELLREFVVGARFDVPEACRRMAGEPDPDSSI